jgi:hypothetical protein
MLHHFLTTFKAIKLEGRDPMEEKLKQQSRWLLTNLHYEILWAKTAAQLPNDCMMVNSS